MSARTALIMVTLLVLAGCSQPGGESIDLQTLESVVTGPETNMEVATDLMEAGLSRADASSAVQIIEGVVFRPMMRMPDGMRPDWVDISGREDLADRELRDLLSDDDYQTVRDYFADES